MSRKPEGPLRKGWTTGACAAAATRAAAMALLTGRFPDHVSARLLRAQTPEFPLALSRTGRADGQAWAEAGIVKDAGDDPDVTHGAMILSRVAHNESGCGLSFHAGVGVGTVTRPGLPIPPGEAAINPGPRMMIGWAIEDALRDVGFPSSRHESPLDFSVTVSIPGGEDLAKKTLNGRLGIRGGLSILGTTGIVVPYSCAAWIHSIQRGIDVARAMGLDHLAAATGSTSEAAVKALLDLPEEALIDMGDFIGGTLKYLRRNPVARLTLAGGFAKMTKLASGALDLHSSRSRVETAALAQILRDLGTSSEVIAAAENAASAGEILEIARGLGSEYADALAGRIAARARDVALAELAGKVAVEIAIFDRQGRLAARAGP